MRGQDDLAAAARASLILRGAEQPAADASVALRFIHPEKPDFGHAAPGVTAEACIDGAIGVSKKDDQPACVPNPCRCEVELVDLLLEELQIFWRRLVTHGKVRTAGPLHGHATRRIQATARLVLNDRAQRGREFGTRRQLGTRAARKTACSMAHRGRSST